MIIPVEYSKFTEYKDAPSKVDLQIWGSGGWHLAATLDYDAYFIYIFMRPKDLKQMCIEANEEVAKEIRDLRKERDSYKEKYEGLQQAINGLAQH